MVEGRGGRRQRDRQTERQTEVRKTSLLVTKKKNRRQVINNLTAWLFL